MCVAMHTPACSCDKLKPTRPCAPSSRNAQQCLGNSAEHHGKLRRERYLQACDAVTVSPLATRSAAPAELTRACTSVAIRALWKQHGDCLECPRMRAPVPSPEGSQRHGQSAVQPAQSSVGIRSSPTILATYWKPAGPPVSSLHVGLHHGARCYTNSDRDPVRVALAQSARQDVCACHWSSSGGWNAEQLRNCTLRRPVLNGSCRSAHEHDQQQQNVADLIRTEQ